MVLTKKQIETLLTMPFADDVEEEGWYVKEQLDDGRLEVQYRAYTIGSWSRFIRPDGGIERWDEDANEFVPTRAEPLIGSYPSHRNTDGQQVMRTFKY